MQTMAYHDTDGDQCNVMQPGTIHTHLEVSPMDSIALHPKKNVKDCTIKQKRVTWYILPYGAFLQTKKDSVLLISSLL